MYVNRNFYVLIRIFYIKQLNDSEKEGGRGKGKRRHPLRDNASLLLFRIGSGYGSASFPIEPCLL